MAFFKNHKYFKTVKVEINEDAWVLLREPTTDEAFSLRTDDENAALEAFRKLLPEIIIDHDFYEDETEQVKLKNSEVAEIVGNSYTGFFEVLNTYTTQVFRSSKSE